MKNKKTIVIILIICVAIIITILYVLLLQTKNNEIKFNNSNEISEQENMEQYKTTTNTKLFFTVDDRIKAYMILLKNNSNEIISYLNDDYIQSNKIDETNIFEVLKKYKNYDSYITCEMLEFGSTNFTSYYVKGRIDGNEVFFHVELDKANKTFAVTPITEEQYIQTTNKKVKKEEFQNKTIKGKQYNFFNYLNLDNNEELVARTYYAEYIKTMLLDTKEAYNKLNKEYKNVKFDTIEKFRQYIYNNSDNLKIAYTLEMSDSTDFQNFNEFSKFKQVNDKLTIKSYSAKQYNEYTQYVCIDGCDNNYIFNVINPGEYTVVLDTYSIDLPQFTEKYNNSKNENKVAMNAEKIKNAINNKDYEYVYNKLDNSFKQNNFSNIEDFERYVNNNLFEYNKFNYEEARKESDIYILTFTIKDLEEKNQEEKNATIIMQLKEGTDFVMSFSLE